MLLRNGSGPRYGTYFGGVGMGIPLPPAAVLAGSAGAFALTGAEGAAPEFALPQPVRQAARVTPISESVRDDVRPMLRVRFMPYSWNSAKVNYNRPRIPKSSGDEIKPKTGRFRPFPTS